MLCSDYPAEGADGLITHSGPKYFDEIYPEAYSMNSFADILALPETDSQLPKWREAYLTGHLKCQEEKPNYELDTRQRVIGLYLDEYQQQKIIAACGEEFGAAFFGVVDTAEPPICSKGARLPAWYSNLTLLDCISCPCTSKLDNSAKLK